MTATNSNTPTSGDAYGYFSDAYKSNPFKGAKGSKEFLSNWAATKLPNSIYESAKKGVTEDTSPTPVPGVYPYTANATPNPDAAIDSTLKYYERTMPMTLDMYQKTSDMDYASQMRVMQGMYPYARQAANEATLRNLEASKNFYKMKQGSPTTVQDIMASQQSQVDAASNAAYKNALGMAAQQNAATNAARIGYTGRTFGVA
jgi:hypothetical protein